MGGFTKKRAMPLIEEVSSHCLRLYSLLPSFAIFFSDNYKEKVNGPFDNCTTDILRPRTHYREIWKRCFPSENTSNVFRPHNTSERLTTQQSAVNLDLCLRKTRPGKSRDFGNVIVFEKPFLKTCPYTRVQTRSRRFNSNSSGLKSVFEKLPLS